MIIVKVGFRDDRLELIAKHHSQWISMGTKYSKLIDGHEIVFKVAAMYTDDSSDFFFSLIEVTSFFQKSARKLNLPLQELIGTEIDEYDDPRQHYDDGDDGLGAFSPDYFGW